MAGELRWGILGCAEIATAMIPAIQAAPGNRVAAIASRSLDKARVWAERYGIDAAFGSYDTLIQSGQIDAIYLPLPNALHVDWTLRCIDAGIPVLCEKPIAVDAAGARRIQVAAEARGVLVAEGYMYRHHPWVQAARDLIESGRLGRLGRLSTASAAFTFCVDEPGTVVDSADLGGGALLDVGGYPISALRTLLGEEPVAIQAMGTWAGGVDQTVVATLRFPSGVIASVETSIGNAERHRLEIAGTEARLVVTDPWIPADRPVDLRIERHGELTEVITIPAADAYALQVESFADALRQNTPLPWGLDDAIATLNVLDQIRAAIA